MITIFNMENKKRCGRPIVAPEKRKKNKVEISFYFSDKEIERIGIERINAVLKNGKKSIKNQLARL